MNTEKDWKWGYKVLRKGRYSAAALCGVVRYLRMKETRPRKKYGPLAVFNSYERARAFAEHQGYECIVCPCIYQESKHYSLWYSEPISMCYNLPDGTRFADIVITGDAI